MLQKIVSIVTKLFLLFVLLVTERSIGIPVVTLFFALHTLVNTNYRPLVFLCTAFLVSVAFSTSMLVSMTIIGVSLLAQMYLKIDTIIMRMFLASVGALLLVMINNTRYYEVSIAYFFGVWLILICISIFRKSSRKDNT